MNSTADTKRLHFHITCVSFNSKILCMSKRQVLSSIIIVGSNQFFEHSSVLIGCKPQHLLLTKLNKQQQQ